MTDQDFGPTKPQPFAHYRPRLLVVENVAALLVRGLDVVLADLAEMGYDARWGSVRASDAGAPHRRERIFLVAYPHDAAIDGERPPVDTDGERHGGGENGGVVGRLDRGDEEETRERERTREVSVDRGPSWGEYGPAVARWERLTRPAPAPTDDKGRLSPRFVEWLMGLPDGYVTDHVGPTPALRMLGNGVVPQQARLALGLLMPT